MPTQIQVPHFKYHSKDPAQRHFGIIELDHAEKYWIDDLDHFYQSFGYSSDMRKWGVLPDEFIWEEYLSDPVKSNKPCFQLHILEYLIKYSTEFLKMHMHEYDDWIATLAKAKASSGDENCVCKACKVVRSMKLNSYNC